MKVLDLNEGDKTLSKSLRLLAMERNPKENLFAILAKNYFKIHRLNDDNEFTEHKITLKKNNVKLNYADMTWDPNKKNVLYLLATPINNPSKRVSNTNLYTLDLEKKSLVVEGKSLIIEEFKFTSNISHLSMSCDKNNSILVYCSKENNIGLFDVKQNNITSTITNNNLGIIYDCKFSPLDENS